jgi:aminopeptidase N
MRHPLFDIKTPNSARSVIGAFAGNPVNFHAKDGSGYGFVAEQVMEIDSFNAILAARLAETLLPPPNLFPVQKALMLAALERIAASSPSANVGEIVHKGLATAV